MGTTIQLAPTTRMMRMTDMSPSQRIVAPQRKPLTQITIMRPEVTASLQVEYSMAEEALLLSTISVVHPAISELLHQASTSKDQVPLSQRERTSTSLRDLASILEIANSEWTNSGTSLWRKSLIPKKEPRETTEIDPNKSDPVALI